MRGERVFQPGRVCLGHSFIRRALLTPSRSHHAPSCGEQHQFPRKPSPFLSMALRCVALVRMVVALWLSVLFSFLMAWRHQPHVGLPEVNQDESDELGLSVGLR